MRTGIGYLLKGKRSRIMAEKITNISHKGFFYVWLVQYIQKKKELCVRILAESYIQWKLIK